MKRILFISIILLLLIYGCGGTTGSDSPSNAVKDFINAVKENNSSKAWNYLSSDSQKLYDTIAKNRNQSGKEYFEKSLSDVNSLGVLRSDYQVVNEKQEGDSAIVYIQIKSGETSQMYAVKEGGVWKFDYARSSQSSVEQGE